MSIRISNNFILHFFYYFNASHRSVVVKVGTYTIYATNASTALAHVQYRSPTRCDILLSSATKRNVKALWKDFLSITFTVQRDFSLFPLLRNTLMILYIILN